MKSNHKYKSKNEIMIWTISLFIVAIIIFYFLRDRDKMLNAQVDGHGGIKEKYSELIEWLLSDPNAKLVKITPVPP